jgi:hypothetical protein
MEELKEKFYEILKYEIKDLNYEEALYYIDNDAIPQTGSVTGLVWYSQTDPIAKEYLDELLPLVVVEYELKPETPNELVWMAWNILILGKGEEILDELGIEEEDYE